MASGPLRCLSSELETEAVVVAYEGSAEGLGVGWGLRVQLKVSGWVGG